MSSIADLVGERLELSGDPESASVGSVLTVRGPSLEAAAMARLSSFLRLMRRMRWISYSVPSLSCVMPFLRDLNGDDKG